MSTISPEIRAERVARMIAKKKSELGQLQLSREILIKELDMKGMSSREIGDLVLLSHVRVREILNGGKKKYPFERSEASLKGSMTERHAPLSDGYTPQHGNNW